jgi:hypothetical protein
MIRVSSALCKSFAYLANAALKHIPLSALGSPDEYGDCICPLCLNFMEKPVKLVNCPHLVHSECIDQRKGGQRWTTALPPLQGGPARPR